MAEASQQLSRTRVYFKIVLAELAANDRFSTETAFRRLVRGCAEGRIHWGVDAPPGPPPLFWKGSVENFTFNGSDVTNAATMVVMDDGIRDVVAFTLEGVWLDWDDVRANVCPELGEVPSPGGLATAVREFLSVLPATVRWLWKGKPNPKPQLSPQEWFNRVMRDDPQKPEQADSEYLDYLYQRMAAEVSEPWKASTLKTRFYDRKRGVS